MNGPLASQHVITVAMPVADRRRTFAFYAEGLGFHPLGILPTTESPSHCSSHSMMGSA